MIGSHLIFSEKRNDRVKRHLLFWLIWGGYFLSLHIAAPLLRSDVPPMSVLPFSITEGILILLCQLPVTYLVLQFILPVYTHERKWLLATSLLLVTWGVYYFCYRYVFEYIFPEVLNWLLPEKYTHNTKRPASITHFMALLAVFIGCFSSTAFICAAKYIKQWYLKEQKNYQLLKENTEAQLQLLKAQVHPHFLFNTLNSIYTQTEKESPKGSKMIRALSGLLHYILMEGNKRAVPLDKELSLVQDYINLEKIRYGNKLDLHYLVTGKTNDIYIAPLLLLPFVENCFKHGASNMLQDPWISLTIEINNTTLVMKLMNGKNSSPDFRPKKLGIGIINVRQRLELLYKNRHELQVREEEDVFVVDLKIEFVRMQEALNPLNQSGAKKLSA